MLNTLLDRNICFVNNCDTKTSIGLAANGVMLTHILEQVETCNDGMYLVPMIFLLIGAACFVYTLKARHAGKDRTFITSFWNSTGNYENDAQSLAQIKTADIEKELQLQIAINANLAKMKYNWYNAGLFCTIFGAMMSIILTVGKLL